jgi:hypothetical protein
VQKSLKSSRARKKNAIEKTICFFREIIPTFRGNPENNLTFLHKCLCFLSAIVANDWENQRPYMVSPVVRDTGLKQARDLVDESCGGEE